MKKALGLVAFGSIAILIIWKGIRGRSSLTRRSGSAHRVDDGVAG